MVREVHTGSELRQRRELTDLRELVRSGAVDVVLAYALDRLSRNQAHLYLLADEAEQAGARLEFVTESFEDSAVGRFIRSAKAFAAEVEREKIIERSTRGRHERARSGRILPGPRPVYGYQWTPDRTGLEEDPVTAAVVRRMFAEIVGGRSLRGLMALLGELGIPTPSGGPATAWAISTIRHVLDNDWYTGEARALRQAKGEVTPALLPAGTVPALIDRATFETVRAQLRLNQARSSRNNHYPEAALLRGGFARCGYCGGTMHFFVGTRGRPDMYRCGFRSRRARGILCRGQSMTAGDLDAAVWGWVHAILTTPSVMDEAIASLAQTSTPRDELAGIERTLAELTRRQTNLVDEMSGYDDPADRASVRARLTSLGVQRRAKEAELDAARARSAGRVDYREMADTLRADWLGNLADERASYQDRRDALESLRVRVWLWHRGSAPRVYCRAQLGPGGPTWERALPCLPVGWVLPAHLEVD